MYTPRLLRREDGREETRSSRGIAFEREDAAALRQGETDVASENRGEDDGSSHYYDNTRRFAARSFSARALAFARFRVFSLGSFILPCVRARARARYTSMSSAPVFRPPLASLPLSPLLQAFSARDVVAAELCATELFRCLHRRCNGHARDIDSASTLKAKRA